MSFMTRTIPMRHAAPRLALAATLAFAAAAATTASAQGPVPPYQSTDPKMRAAVEDLVAANRILSNKGILPGYGHVSMRSPVDPNRMLIARSLAPGQVTAADIVELDLDCNPVIPSKVLLYQERFIHCAIYKARPDVGGVVHDHAPYGIAFSITKVPLRPVSNPAKFLGFNGPPVHDASSVPGVTNNLIATPEMGASLARTLGKSAVVLMRGHGATVTSADVRGVVSAAIATEENAMMLTQAKILGGPITYLDPKNYGDERLAREIGAEARGWNALKFEAMGK